MVRLFFLGVTLICFAACNSLQFGIQKGDMTNFDWQGHRGARGLLPENTIPSMLEALKYPVRTLELDVVITKDKQVVLSHEPWMSSEICLNPDGTVVTKDEGIALKIYEMSYEEVQAFDCGSRGNTRFGEQGKMASTKVRLVEMVETVEAYVREKRLEKPYYNIEIKSKPEWDDLYTPKPDVFAKLLLEEIKKLGISNRTVIQSFDPRALQASKAQAPEINLALLVKNEDGINKNLERLGFTPYIYSSHHSLMNATEVKQLHAKGMKVIPWTVNEVARMQELIAIGVDGIITDYPNLILEVEAIK